MPVVTRLCPKAILIRGAKTEKKVESEFKTNRTPAKHQHLPTNAISSQTKDWVLTNRRLTIRNLHDDVGIPFGLTQTILKYVLCTKRVLFPLIAKALVSREKKH